VTALERLTASEGARLIATGRITAESLVRACLDRIEAREPIVRAWTFLDPDAAIRQARQRDRTTPTGPLHGVPIGVKDVIDTAGSAVFNAIWTAMRLPCVTLPSSRGANELPVGLQLVGRSGRDRELLGLARRVARWLIG
jgi:Asp-tRNA(Asn)/Glu-tRNA(Gln) amidotransferase A subunit family amidase